jgi:hypothetical protein
MELIAMKTLDRANAAQSINRLTATGLRVCRLLNFGTPHRESQRIAN